MTQEQPAFLLTQVQSDDDEKNPKPNINRAISPRAIRKNIGGDAGNIIYRSGWEETAFHWCDMNRHVIAWASEKLPIPYFMKGIRYRRNYYPDLLIYFSNGETVMVEIKPGDQKANPNYENRCKWAAARAYCREEGWAFRIWDEETIEKLRPKIAIWQRYH